MEQTGTESGSVLYRIDGVGGVGVGRRGWGGVGLGREVWECKHRSLMLRVPSLCFSACFVVLGWTWVNNLRVGLPPRHPTPSPNLPTPLTLTHPHHFPRLCMPGWLTFVAFNDDKRGWHYQRWFEVFSSPMNIIRTDCFFFANEHIRGGLGL